MTRNDSGSVSATRTSGTILKVHSPSQSMSSLIRKIWLAIPAVGAAYSLFIVLLHGLHQAHGGRTFV